MAIQPYEIANFNLIEFASVYNDFIDTNNEKEMQVQYMDKDGNIYNITLKNVAAITKTIKGDIEAEAALREKADAELAQKITEVNTSLSTKIAEEIQNRINADKKLQETIDFKYNEVSDKISKVQTDLVNEIDRAAKAEAKLENKINQEIQDRINADKELDNKVVTLVSAESEMREKADNDLLNKITEVETDFENKINKEIQDRINGDNAVLESAKSYTENLINDEANKRELADGDLNFNDDIVNENGEKADDLTEAINIVDNRLNQEITRAKTIENNLQQTDKELQNKIDEVNNKIEAILAGASTDLDSFKEIVEYINSIDAENDEIMMKFMKDTLTKFGVLFKGVGFDEDGYITPEQAHYINNATSLYNADKELDNALYVVSNNIEAEVTRAKSAEAKLQESIENEIKRATKAEGNLNFDDTIINENGEKADDLTEAINDVNKKVDALYGFFHLTYKPYGKQLKTDNIEGSFENNTSSDNNKDINIDFDALKSRLNKIFSF